MKENKPQKLNIDFIVTVPIDYHSSCIKRMCLIVELISDNPVASYLTRIPEISRKHLNTYSYYSHILN